MINLLLALAAEIVDYLKFTVVAGHKSHTGKRGGLLGLELGVTACDNNLCLRITAGKATDGLSALLVGHLGDATCVDHDIVRGVAGMYALYPLAGKQPGDGRGLGEIEFAAESVI